MHIIYEDIDKINVYMQVHCTCSDLLLSRIDAFLPFSLLGVHVKRAHDVNTGKCFSIALGAMKLLALLA